MRNDPKIKALRRKYSHIGYSVWNMILELLTSNEYFEYEWNELNIELLAPDFDIDADELDEIVSYCIKIGLLQITNGYLHCEKLTFRLEETLLLRRKGYDRNNSLRSVVNVNNNEVNVNINTQSKVKESKLKESKAKDSKAEESIEEKPEDSSPVYVLNKNYKKGYTPDQLDKAFEEFDNIVNK
jgi:soluble cytochrome b562